MKSSFDLLPRLQTAWSGNDILVLRNDAEIDRIHAPDIERVVFVQPGDTLSASDLSFSLIELTDEYVVFPVETGLAGRVHFERQAFWAAKGCVYWADSLIARLPARYLVRRGLSLTRRSPCYLRIPRVELEPVIENWLLEGPQSWDERRWRRIERSQPFARIDTRIDSVPPRAERTPLR